MSGLCILSRDILQVTGSLFILILACCCIVLCHRSSCECVRVTELFTEHQRTVTVYHIGGAMASEDRRPEDDQSGVSFRNPPWISHRFPPGDVTL